MIKAVLFDLDETLLDRTESLKRFLLWQAQEIIQGSGAENKSFCRRFIELDANGSVDKQRVYTQLIDEFQIYGLSVSELSKCYEIDFSKFICPKPNSLEAVRALHKLGYKLALVSNGNSPFQERNFESLGISSLFSSVAVSNKVGYRKPQREIFEIACNALNLSPEEAIFVGDNPIADIQGAKEVGMYTIYLPGHFGEDCENADRVCKNYSELVQLIQTAK